MALRLADDRGIALLITLLAISLFSALGLALSLSSAVDRMAAANHEQAVHLLNMADAALELSARDLGALPDWNAVLDGRALSSLVDGTPDGIRRPFPDTVIDLTGLTNDLTCGRAAGCTEVSRMATTRRTAVGRKQSHVAAVPLRHARRRNQSARANSRLRHCVDRRRRQRGGWEYGDRWWRSGGRGPIYRSGPCGRVRRRPRLPRD